MEIKGSRVVIEPAEAGIARDVFQQQYMAIQRNLEHPMREEIIDTICELKSLDDGSSEVPVEVSKELLTKGLESRIGMYQSSRPSLGTLVLDTLAMGKSGYRYNKSFRDDAKISSKMLDQLTKN